ncbi:MAG: alpha-glucosidase, partial [Alphaproteobacteria bacterium]|nr:alpha-glucosidase [Alphaproteobacteria bacterium]
MKNDWWKGAVIYQVYPRSFNDANGDGVGDIKGITKKLDYIKSLGVDAIWISPFFPSPMKDFGYDVSDYCGVDPLFGDVADFDKMMAEAHKRDIKIVIDMVLSHTSDQHKWFEESRKDRTNPKADWFVWADPKPDGSPPNNWQSVFGGPSWEFDMRRGQYYLHNFLKEQPDLNLHNPAVRKALLDSCRFWLDRGVDGFRLDATTHFFHSPGLKDNPVNPNPRP